MKLFDELANIVKRRGDTALHVVAFVGAFVALVAPFALVTYPQMVDLPMHAAQTSALRHLSDPSYAFDQQFELHPLGYPYMSSYALGAVLMSFMSAIAATKIANVVLLAFVPAGLATLAWGMRRSPLIALAAVPFAFSGMALWGTVSSLSAIGMMAMALGLTLRALERPSPRLFVATGAVLALTFFTQVFRAPIAIASVAIAWAFSDKRRETVRPLLLACLPTVALLVAFLALRPAGLRPDIGPITLRTDRLSLVFDTVVSELMSKPERAAARRHVAVVVAIGFATFGIAWARRATQPASSFERRAHWTLVCTIALCCLGYLFLPDRLGIYFGAAAREATSVTYLAIALIPNLPRELSLRAAAVAAMLWSALSITDLAILRFVPFDTRLEAFTSISEQIPKAPKLCYLVYDEEYAMTLVPAYVQAEKGGFLSYHFASIGASPFAYRTDEAAVVPPPAPGAERFQWRPELFDLAEQGPFFDWFLVVSNVDRSLIFVADPTIRLVDHRGDFWLYTRTTKP
ncbi:MAG: hypothetical protein HOW73_07120 [Polyangiaceae bacterium]|nr:hypothetical protein [Polyangiaceae bacterium]